MGIVDLTDGEPTPHSPGPDVRLAEARQAAEILGVALRINLNMPNRRLFDSFEARVALAKVFRRHRPKVVLGFGGKTVLASPDHYQAMLITDAAVFYSRLTKWDEHFDGLPPPWISNQLSFPIALHGLDLPEASGYIVADIGPTLEVKLEAIRCLPDPVSRQQGGHLPGGRDHEPVSRPDGGFRGGRAVPDVSFGGRRRPDALGQPRTCPELVLAFEPVDRFSPPFSFDLRGSEESQAPEQVTNSRGNSARPMKRAQLRSVSSFRVRVERRRSR